ncbi:hypothetical protein NHX12_027138 [Muraenolepis orangiensis]|uniref:Uncharacterized protein n=1 Tax=Muraenolepis orangiensis TaxID=630683 RepID=A0A9Q0EGE1_9TELE|nr:hypothetical protein NHX12_027138 [Muraenolepis orangiensis]
MARDWPRLEAQTWLAVKKEQPLEEKVLADVRKKVNQVGKMLKPALENTDLFNATAQEARETGMAAANVDVAVDAAESKDSVVQAKLSCTASRHLVGHLDAALQQLAQRTTHLRDGKVPLQRFDHILNGTRQRLAVLRASVESPSLGGKIQRLQQMGQEQRGRLALFEDNLRDAGKEWTASGTSPSHCQAPVHHPGQGRAARGYRGGRWWGHGWWWWWRHGWE